MKLYVWNSPYGVSYGSSVLYAIANNEDEAREAAKAGLVSEFGYDPKKRDWLAEQELGAPDRVIDGPYAEYYEWSE